jgi:hypothetical protein
MSTVLAIVVLLVAAAVAFFTWANWATARAHARLGSKEVEAALSEVLAPDSPTHDNFDLFLAWPIDDPYLESVRQHCLRIIGETDPAPPGQDLSDGGLRRIAALLDEVRNRAREGNSR